MSTNYKNESFQDEAKPLLKMAYEIELEEVDYECGTHYKNEEDQSALLI